ncbi:MAG: helix-turn-helix domain-containing protein [Verrucomicrobia bacterium]|nr:helix-turn-helix domain-containing protein [Verrucomicrobiota bacterium]
MVETVGTRLRAARLRRGLEIDQASEATKIRPERLAELEAGDYSHFPSLTYARSFLTKYANFLGVDIRDELENFRVSHSICLAEYQYLSSAPVKYTPEPRLFEPRAFRVPPLLVAFLVLLVLVGLPVFAYLAVGITRLQPPGTAEAATPAVKNELAMASPSPESTRPAAPTPVDAASLQAQEDVASILPELKLTGTPAPLRSTASPGLLPAPVAATGTPVVEPRVTPSGAEDLAGVVVPPASPSPVSAEPGATPVLTEVSATPAVAPAPDGHDSSTGTATPAPAASATPAGVSAESTPPDGKRLEVRALRRTYIRVVRDERGSEPVFSGYTSPKAEPIVVKGKRFWLKVSDRRAIEVRENGQIVRGHSPNIVIN